MHILAKLGQENLRMVRWMRWHCPPDIAFEIRTLAVWGRVRYFSFTEAPRNIESLRMSREETFCFFETWMPERGSNPRSPTSQADSPRPCNPADTRLGAKVLGTSVLEYRFCSTRRYSVLVLLKSTCTRTCTRVLLKIKVLLTSTYEYFTSTNHLKLVQNSSQKNHKSL